MTGAEKSKLAGMFGGGWDCAGVCGGAEGEAAYVEGFGSMPGGGPIVFAGWTPGGAA